jgi:hypothetical protein
MSSLEEYAKHFQEEIEIILNDSFLKFIDECIKFESIQDAENTKMIEELDLTGKGENQNDHD